MIKNANCNILFLHSLNTTASGLYHTQFMEDECTTDIFNTGEPLKNI